MINEQITLMMQAYAARLKVVEGDNALMQAALDALKPDWRTPKGASGTMTPVEETLPVIGRVIPKGDSANVRTHPSTRDHAFIISTLNRTPTAANYADVIDRHSDEFDVFNYETGKPFVWYKLRSGGYVREDVVTFTPDKPATPIHAALWPSPVGKYTVTNTHENHRDHDGLDYACPLGTPIQAGPNGAYVAKAFACTVCNPNGDGPNSLNDPNKAFGYGSHVILRYAYDVLPAGLKAAIPNGAYVYAIHAHMSQVFVSQGQTLDAYHVIGDVGMTGNVYSIGGGSPSHLHYALRWSTHPDASWSGMNNNRINPSLLVKA